ncbi:MAG: RluA family pseudouridine synthase [Phycisphaeraceae bacterium]|nr:RluA family pseudouridine synthase [Phycisphaeraceae bacterium]
MRTTRVHSFDSILKGIHLVHRTSRFVVVEKPSGVLSVPGIGPEKADCVVSRVHSVLSALGAAPALSSPGQMIVHRLDMDTSGLMVVALDADSQRQLSLQFEERRPEKTYIALVAGLVRADEGTIDLPMRLDVENRPYQIVDHAHGRPAKTHFRVLARETDRTRVEFRPITGRTHQIRVHASKGLGHPILGDPLYGDHPDARLMLHAAFLSFVEPGGAARLEFRSAPPF